MKSFIPVWDELKLEIDQDVGMEHEIWWMSQFGKMKGMVKD